MPYGYEQAGIESARRWRVSAATTNHAYLWALLQLMAWEAPFLLATMKLHFRFLIVQRAIPHKQIPTTSFHARLRFPERGLHQLHLEVPHPSHSRNIQTAPAFPGEGVVMRDI